MYFRHIIINNNYNNYDVVFEFVSRYYALLTFHILKLHNLNFIMNNTSNIIAYIEFLFLYSHLTVLFLYNAHKLISNTLYSFDFVVLFNH